MRYPLEYDEKTIDDLIEMSTEEVVWYLVYLIRNSWKTSKIALEKLCMIIDRLKEQNNVTHINKVDLQELLLMRDWSLDPWYIVKEKEIVNVISNPRSHWKSRINELNQKMVDPFFYKYKIWDVLVTRMWNKYTVVNKRNWRYECKLKEKRGRYAMKELMMSDETIDHQATLLLMEDKW